MSEPDQKVEGLEIRETQAPDMEPIVSLLKDAHNESRFGEFEFAQVRLRQFLKSAFKDTDGTSIRGFMARVSGEPVGLVSASLNPMLTSPQLFAATLIFYVRKEHRGTQIPKLLLDHIAAWARSKDAVEIRTSVTFGEDYGAERSNAYFRKMGFKSSGENFHMALK